MWAAAQEAKLRVYKSIHVSQPTFQNQEPFRTKLTAKLIQVNAIIV